MESLTAARTWTANDFKDFKDLQLEKKSSNSSGKDVPERKVS